MRKAIGCLAALLAAALLLVSCDAPVGKDDTESLSAPTVTQVGCMFTWEPIEGATEYAVTLGETTVCTAKTAVLWEGFESGGSVSVKAVKRSGDKTVESAPSAPVEVPMAVYNAANCVTYTLSDEDIVIPATVEKCVIKGDGADYDASVIIKNRSFPLLIELDNVSCEYIGIEGGSVNTDVPAAQIVMIRTVGEEPSRVYGVTGRTGTAGADGGGILGAGGDGGTGGVGCDGGRFHNVLFMGDRDLIFAGGRGGTGGKGGDPTGINTKPGVGGNGGTGGCGLRVANCFIAMENATVITRGGTGGAGGLGGSPRGFLDKQKNGSAGGTGVEFSGNKTVYSAFEIVP